ncbi:MAG: hypothetical protein ACREDL_16360, partial [Bradyrhizobium sp.]
GSIPLEAQRLGLEAYASDSNPVAVLINKAMIEIPPRFAGRPPVCLHAEDGIPRPSSQETVAGAEAGRGSAGIGDTALPASDAPVVALPGHRRGKASEPSEPYGAALPQPPSLFGTYRGAQGLAEDVRYYGKWMRDEAFKRIGHLYPPIEITPEMVADRPDLKPYEGRKLTVIAWLWARTVKSPNPAFSSVDVPLASTFVLSSKPGKEAYVQPVIEKNGYRFTVKVGKPPAEAKAGTKAARGANFRCLMSQTPVEPQYIKAEAVAGRMGAKLMAIVAEGSRGRIYLDPISSHETIAKSANPDEAAAMIHVPLANDPRNLWCLQYGLDHFDTLFTSRQLVALTTFSDLVGEARERIRHDALAAGLADDDQPLDAGGAGVRAYAEAVSVYLGFNVGRQGNRGCTISFWDSASQKIQQAFGRQALPMTWDFCESNPFSDSSGNWIGQLDFPAKCVLYLPSRVAGLAVQQDARNQAQPRYRFVSTDPPYYDNIGYA